MTGNPLALATPEQTASRKKERLFLYGKGARHGKGIICVTDSRGQPKYEWRSEVVEAVRKVSGDPRTEIVVDASEGFGLRHFFALISENEWPAIIYGEHKKFSIMNYGPDSKLTDADRADLRRLYDKVWSREISALNGTRVELMRPYSSQ